MVLASGMRPIITVAMPIMSSVVMRVFFRPIRSPKWPKMIAPTGRAKKATANVPKEAMVPAAAPRAGKNTTGKTRAAAVP